MSAAYLCQCACNSNIIALLLQNVKFTAKIYVQRLRTAFSEWIKIHKNQIFKRLKQRPIWEKESRDARQTFISLAHYMAFEACKLHCSFYWSSCVFLLSLLGFESLQVMQCCNPNDCEIIHFRNFVLLLLQEVLCCFRVCVSVWVCVCFSALISIFLHRI